MEELTNNFSSFSTKEAHLTFSGKQLLHETQNTPSNYLDEPIRNRYFLEAVRDIIQEFKYQDI
jgi:hypothetical protein